MPKTISLRWVPSSIKSSTTENDECIQSTKKTDTTVTANQFPDGKQYWPGFKAAWPAVFDGVAMPHLPLSDGRRWRANATWNWYLWTSGYGWVRENNRLTQRTHWLLLGYELNASDLEIEILSSSHPPWLRCKNVDLRYRVFSAVNRCFSCLQSQWY